jgi:protease II
LLVVEISRGFTQVIWSNTGGKSQKSSKLRIPFEDPAFDIAVYPKYVNWKEHTVDIEYSSLRVPTSYYKFKWGGNHDSSDYMKIVEIVGGLTNKFDSSLYISAMNFAINTHDNTKIPYITVARRDIHKRITGADDCAEIAAAASATDIGVNARGVVIFGYGSYGSLLGLNFRPWISYLVDRGFVVCGAMIRGGGEGGFSWYEAGRNTGK